MTSPRIRRFPSQDEVLYYDDELDQWSRHELLSRSRRSSTGDRSSFAASWNSLTEWQQGLGDADDKDADQKAQEMTVDETPELSDCDKSAVEDEDEHIRLKRNVSTITFATTVSLFSETEKAENEELFQNLWGYSAQTRRPHTELLPPLTPRSTERRPDQSPRIYTPPRTAVNTIRLLPPKQLSVVEMVNLGRTPSYPQIAQKGGMRLKRSLSLEFEDAVDYTLPSCSPTTSPLYITNSPMNMTPFTGKAAKSCFLYPPAAKATSGQPEAKMQ